MQNKNDFFCFDRFSFFYLDWRKQDGNRGRTPWMQALMVVNNLKCAVPLHFILNNHGTKIHSVAPIPLSDLIFVPPNGRSLRELNSFKNSLHKLCRQYFQGTPAKSQRTFKILATPSDLRSDDYY